MSLVVCILFPSGEGVRFLPFAEACLRFTPTVALREGEAVFLDITGCEKQDSQEGLSARIQVLAKRLIPSSAPPRISFASDAARALVSARFKNRDGDWPLEAWIDYASPFRRDFELQKKITHWIETLKDLGVGQWSDFLKLSPRSLASRLGKEAVDLFHAVEGLTLTAWPGFLPAEKIQEEMEFLEELWALEPVLFGIRTLVDRIAARLRGLAKRISVIQIRFTLKPWSIAAQASRQWKFEFPLPQGSGIGIMPMIQDQLGFDLQKTPLSAPVQAIQLEVLETVPGNGAQRDFFSSREEETELWNAWVSRLVVRLGEGSVFMAAPVDRYLPEESWAKTLELQKSSANESVKSQGARPSRILKTPEPLRIWQGVFMNSQGKRWRIQKWEGPERLSGEWWLKSFDRDYYRILTSEGEQLWVFLDRSLGRYYLHGYFD